MGKDWDAPWKTEGIWATGAGMSKPGIGDRAIPWPSFGNGSVFGGANPSCATCGGRLRGEKKCDCADPDWHINGEPVGDGSELEVSQVIQQRQAFQKWAEGWLAECHRVLIPGGVAKVFGGTRMFHRMGAAMQNVGFKLDAIEAWTYGSGFPKSLNVAIAIDKAAGAMGNRAKAFTVAGKLRHLDVEEQLGSPDVTLARHVPITEDAKRFSGFGTALKPSWEPFLVGRKPSEK